MNDNEVPAMIRQRPNGHAAHIPFGAYLVSKNLISPGELEAALLCQSDQNAKLGAIATKEHLLTFNKVREIYDYQLRHRLPFGEAAVALGLLSKDEVDSLLEKQSMHHKMLGEILVELNVMSEEKMQSILDSYFRELGELTEARWLNAHQPA